MLFLKSSSALMYSQIMLHQKYSTATTKDLATAEIQKSLLNARTLGEEQLLEFVEKRQCLQ